MSRKQEFKVQSAVLHADDDIIVVSKPAGLLSIADRFDPLLPNLRQVLEDEFGEVLTVHRLDRDTSGVMLFARTADAHRELNRQFAERAVYKLYHALVGGVMREDEMKVDIPIAPNPVRKGLMMPSVRGKEALTLLKVLQRFRMATLVECDLRTGRQHQIRVHLAAIGHALLVDPDYGESEGFMLSSIKRRYNLAKHTEERPIIGRVTLHSRTVRFNHPATQEKMEFTAEYPKDFSAALQVLNKYAPHFEKFNWEQEFGSEDWE